MTKKPVGGQTKGTQTALFQKTMKISLVGNSQDEIKEVAHAIHALSHPLTTGTRHKRKVTLTTLHSSDVVKIFDGKVQSSDQ
jgi:hypothetical protein